jgi:DNA-binding transcriptional ArsR family regulator
MVERATEHLDGIFHALADATRREIVRSLIGKERSISEIAEPFSMTLAAVSKHVKVLERAGLVERTVQGRNHLCRLVPHAMSDAFEWLRYYEEFWDSRLDALDRLFKKPERE